MRLIGFAVLATLGASPAVAQENTARGLPLGPSCTPIANQLRAEPIGETSKLYIQAKNRSFVPVSRTWLLNDGFSLPEYKDGQVLKFIYVPRRKIASKPQYLAIRTRSVGVTDYNFVTLKKQKTRSARDVEYGTFNQYHKGLTDNSTVLRHYHDWYPDRSDTPSTTRNAYLFNQSEWYSGLFKKKKEISIRRLLTIKFQTAEDHQTCVPFSLGPHLATACELDSEDADCDEVSLLNSFVVDITEARTFSGEAGATFTVQFQGR